MKRLITILLLIACIGYSQTWTSVESSTYVKADDSLNVGDAMTVNNSGYIEWPTGYEKRLVIRPNLINSQNKINNNKPTEVYRGCNIGYSFPIYASDNEELFYRQRIPSRYDGVTDPQFALVTTISGTEDVGDKYKFCMSVVISHRGNILSDTSTCYYSEQVVLTGRTSAYNIYTIFFNFDASDSLNPIVPGYMMQGCLRRVASGGPEVTNEIMVWDWATSWAVNKAYPEWSVEVNEE